MNAFIIVGVFVILDIITGLLKAGYNRNINSTILRQGLYHKITEFITLGVAVFLEQGSQYIHLGIEVPFVSTVSVYVCIMEFTSVLENLCEINPNLKKFFEPYLAKLRSKK